MKIEACCPNCGKDYLGHHYTNPSLSTLDQGCNMAEKFSIFNEWQHTELTAKPEA